MDGEQIAVQDFGSKNGTFLGGTCIREVLAGMRMILTLGRSTLTCVGGEVNEEASAVCPISLIWWGRSLVIRRLADQVRWLVFHSLVI
ncbi:hypothetical protein BCY86_01640 [Pajaroellobacter abortibovis]|uniref:FHA domain-containing protein n=1 Tax=Pajaroellobacter abortibovis TaxID=1882918 RepID=A0A1L6MVM4_9BACT|nr:hypothetical protein [Pajaroellobacter abortibovis]APR99524.1 hypothetical protein BCY86_01640 [Pajaroellobacter abortibovis]